MRNKCIWKNHVSQPSFPESVKSKKIVILCDLIKRKVPLAVFV